MGWTLGPASPGADLADAAWLFGAYAQSIGVDLAFQGFAAELAGLPGQYAPPLGALLLARAGNGGALGCVALRPLDAPGCCEMKRLYVTPEGRGLGLGWALVQAVIGAATRIGYGEMRLDTLPDMTGALALYRRARFVPIEPYYPTPLARTIFLGRQLGPAAAI